MRKLCHTWAVKPGVIFENPREVANPKVRFPVFSVGGKQDFWVFSDLAYSVYDRPTY
jgi:hypothetical protein